jgi:hypothetical protein
MTSATPVVPTAMYVDVVAPATLEGGYQLHVDVEGVPSVVVVVRDKTSPGSYSCTRIYVDNIQCKLMVDTLFDCILSSPMEASRKVPAFAVWSCHPQVMLLLATIRTTFQRAVSAMAFVTVCRSVVATPPVAWATGVDPWRSDKS